MACTHTCAAPGLADGCESCSGTPCAFSLYSVPKCFKSRIIYVPYFSSERLLFLAHSVCPFRIYRESVYCLSDLRDPVSVHIKVP